RRRHTRFSRDWSSDVCSSDLLSSDELLGDVAIDRSNQGQLLVRRGLDGACPVLIGATSRRRSVRRRHSGGIDQGGQLVGVIGDRSEERRVGKGVDVGGGRVVV